MNTDAVEIIKRCSAGSLDGRLSFPQVVGMLMDIGVSHYQVDFVRDEKTCYFRNDEFYTEPMPMPAEPIAQEFSPEGVAAAVKASQTEGQAFPDFLVRVRKAGCIGYVAYLDGRRVVYTGRRGDEHVEHFPS